MMKSVQQKTPTKRSNPKKKNLNNNNKPMKVVYISNPMKVKTSPSEFRALVQELTGQDAESPPDPSRFQKPGGDDGDHSTSTGYKLISDDWFVKIEHDVENDQAQVAPRLVDPNSYCQGQGQLASGSSSSVESFEPFDDVFTPQMIESISAMMPDSVFYQSPLLD
ncbi:hypothetical protein Lal_00000735 [Lupinus albus]|uniref:Uncharacterized protein n=1 Tax=Lupinus albus TaxID=3870 RepID=A0A6A4N9G6_LUPAL|nr:hypothetical protein Lalb_Chr24g0400351 [Lupinus albus]KAF1858915.1 hypothetical protein Lal_00000735 [Lupinus albus]